MSEATPEVGNQGPSCLIFSPDLEIHTERLRLVAATAPLALAALENRKRFSVLIGATPDPNWPSHIIRNALTYFADTLTDQPDLSGWLMWYVIRVEDGEPPMVVGSCAFNGPPDEEGSVRVGFSVVERWRKRRYASEAVRGLCKWAFQHGAKRVWTKVPKDEEPMRRVVNNVGMQPSGLPLEDESQVYELLPGMVLD